MTYSSPTIGPDIPCPGDEVFSKMLKGVGSPLSFAEVRAFFFGTVASTGHAPMQAAHDHIFGGNEPALFWIIDLI